MTIHGETYRKSVTGSALIFTLWILVCLSLMSMGLSHRVRLETKATAYTVANMEAFYIAEMALYKKLVELMGYRESKEGKEPKSAEKKSKEEEADIRCTVVREESKINMNRAPEEILRRLEPLKGGGARVIMTRRHGADMRSGTKDDAPFLLVEELLSIAEIEPEDWYGNREEGERGLRELLTVYGDGRIDVNSAPLEVLEAIPDVNRRLAEQIIAFRAGPDGKLGTGDDRRWKSSSELRKSLKLSKSDVIPFQKHCKFGSDYCTVTVTARKKGSRATARISAVARVHENEFEIVSWRED